MGSKLETINAYVDGSYGEHSRVGSWAAWFSRAGKPYCFGGSEIAQDSARMELMAAVCLMESIDFVASVNLYTDAKHVADGFGNYRQGWIDGTLCKPSNLDLWGRLFKAHAASGCELRVQWVRSHGGNDGNARADRLARNYRRAMEELIGYVPEKKRS